MSCQIHVGRDAALMVSMLLADMSHLGVVNPVDSGVKNLRIFLLGKRG